MKKEFDIYSVDEVEETKYLKKYRELVSRKTRFLFILIAVLMILVIITVNIGPYPISFSEVMSRLFRFNSSDGIGHVVWNIRFVEIVACLLTGAALAVAGVAMQSILRNPLASPYTLGLSSAAAFGAAFSIVFLQTGSMAFRIVIDNPYITVVSAFFFAMLATGMILLLTKVTKVSAETMVLAGIAITAIFSALLALTQFVATENQLANIVYWTFGSMSRASWNVNTMVFLVLLPVVLYFISRRWVYNAMDSGEESAKTLGINTERERLIGMVISSFIAAVVVSFFGTIAFIGLLGPHIARFLIGSDHRYLIPASVMLGAIILLVSNTIGLNLLGGQVIPVGIITSIMGGPLFIALLIRRYRH